MPPEIELKICLIPENIPHLQIWLDKLQPFQTEQMMLSNTYYDTPERFFQQHKMGLRVRGKNAHYELTLKTEGQIISGLHVRPEYNLALDTPTPALKRLVSEHNLQIEQLNEIEQHLKKQFSIDFNRTTWLLKYQQSVIEIALDHGKIKAADRQEPICEMEFELKEGSLTDLLALLNEMPTRDGMWLESMSKAERGYMLAEPALFAKKVAKLTACSLTMLSDKTHFHLEQQFGDAIRREPSNLSLIIAYNQLTQNRAAKVDLATYLVSAQYLKQNIEKLKILL